MGIGGGANLLMGWRKRGSLGCDVRVEGRYILSFVVKYTLCISQEKGDLRERRILEKGKDLGWFIPY